ACKFMMGTPENEEGRFDDESPRHPVTIKTPFAVGKFAVTFDEWDACVAAAACPKVSAYWGGGRMPVVNVTWEEAKQYVRWLSWLTGKEYRLLSEAEREYVTRAGTTTAFWWGDTISTSQANFNGNYTFRGGAKGEYRQKTVAVDVSSQTPGAFTMS